jgi:hypothetical protein
MLTQHRAETLAHVPSDKLQQAPATMVCGWYLASSSPPSTKSAVDIPTFADAITNLIIQKNAKYESVALVSNNNFICGLSYEPTVMEVKGEEICKERST